MTEITKGLIAKIERATQSAQIQIRRSVAIDEAQERINSLSLSIAISAGASRRSIESAAAASGIIRNTTTISEVSMVSSSLAPEIASSMRPPIASTYEMSDMTMTPIIAPTPIIPSLFDIREIQAGR
jgi:hypothetical protein